MLQRWLLSDHPCLGRALNRLSPTNWFALLVGASCVIFQAVDLVQELRFDRIAILNGEWWRLLSGNLVHLGWSHLLLNLSGLAVICYLVGHALSARQWLIVFIACLLGVGTGLLLIDLQLTWYVGLSGVLYGLLIAGAIADFTANRWISGVLIVYTVGKIGHEQFYGAAAASELLAGGKVIVNAHLYGLVSGAFAVCAVLLLSAKPASPGLPDQAD